MDYDYYYVFKPTYVEQIHLKSITHSQTGFIHNSQVTKLITNCIELKICNFIYFKPTFIRNREKKLLFMNIFCRKQVAKIIVIAN